MADASLFSLVKMGLLVLVLLFSVIIHEVAHGYVAGLNGDPTARMLGRLTLNPLPHIDPFGTILLPLLLYLAHLPVVGMAKPVPVNPLNFRNYRWGEFAVSAAGPLSNLALAVAFSLLLRLSFGNPGVVFLAQLGIEINVLLALFNLIPIPPLDGSHVLAILLPRELARLYSYLQPVGFILILILFYTGILGAILTPLYRQLLQILLG